MFKDICADVRCMSGLLGGIWVTKNLNHLAKTILLIQPSVVPVNSASAGAPLMRSRETLCHGKIIMGGKACPDSDPLARAVFVHPFSAAVIVHTAFCPLFAQTFDGWCTHDIPVSSAL